MSVLKAKIGNGIQTCMLQCLHIDAKEYVHVLHSCQNDITMAVYTATRCSVRCVQVMGIRTTENSRLVYCGLCELNTSNRFYSV